MPKSMEFANTFQLSVGEGIANTLGVSVMETLKNLLNHSFKTYAEKPAEFHRELSRFFGSAAITLEKMITKDLFQRLDLHYSKELEFETSINLARHGIILSQKGND